MQNTGVAETKFEFIVVFNNLGQVFVRVRLLDGLLEFAKGDFGIDAQKVVQFWKDRGGKIIIAFVVIVFISYHLLVRQMESVASHHGRMILLSKGIPVAIQKGLKFRGVNVQTQVLRVGVRQVQTRLVGAQHGYEDGEFVLAPQDNLFDAKILHNWG